MDSILVRTTGGSDRFDCRMLEMRKYWGLAGAAHLSSTAALPVAQQSGRGDYEILIWQYSAAKPK